MVFIQRVFSRDVTKSISPLQQAIAQASKSSKRKASVIAPEELITRIQELEKDMRAAAEQLDFSKAILLREEWMKLKKSIKTFCQNLDKINNTR